MNRSATLTIRSPAKVNLSLEILGRRTDGYHEIDSVMQTISLADALHFSRTRKIECIISSTEKIPGRAEQNLIHQAWRLMRRRFPDPIGGARVQIEKQIPIGAGLGGGSSNAAATLIALNRLFGLRLSKPALAELAAELGSDVPFFIQGGAARCKGRGEIVHPLPAAPALHLVLVYPGFRSSTPTAYSKITACDFTRGEHSGAMARAIEAGDPHRIGARLWNVFDTVLSLADPRYLSIKAAMLAAGLENPILSGSGSTVFSIARDAAAARRAAARLRPLYPKTFVARTVGPGFTRIIHREEKS